MNWFVVALKNYAVFSGRSRRSEYWYFVLFYLIIYVVLAFVDGIAGTFNSRSGAGLFTTIFALGLLIPSLSVSVRRLHDTDRSGWWLLIGLIPLIGVIVLIVFFAQDSGAGTNRFGPNPKAAT
ncbi:MAG TPA: DUF805 domain-containing protein [Burkholderiales bacterium]|nr:DUF805 domain-containing protein [Burkholderiales bacterium]